MNLLIKHSQIHGVNTTIELLRIANKAVEVLSKEYDCNSKITKLEKLTSVSKNKLWEKSKGADDRLAFCKAVMTLLWYNKSI